MNEYISLFLVTNTGRLGPMLGGYHEVIGQQCSRSVGALSKLSNGANAEAGAGRPLAPRRCEMTDLWSTSQARKGAT